MQTNTMLALLIGFFAGGLLVAVAATTFDKPDVTTNNDSMSAMNQSLANKTGDEFDAAFLNHMIEHHESAIVMAELANERSGRAEIKQLSREIESAQQREIDQMKAWRTQWNLKYESGEMHQGQMHQ